MSSRLETNAQQPQSFDNPYEITPIPITIARDNWPRRLLVILDVRVFQLNGSWQPRCIKRTMSWSDLMLTHAGINREPVDTRWQRAILADPACTLETIQQRSFNNAWSNWTANCRTFDGDWTISYRGTSPFRQTFGEIPLFERARKAGITIYGQEYFTNHSDGDPDLWFGEEGEVRHPDGLGLPIDEAWYDILEGHFPEDSLKRWRDSSGRMASKPLLKRFADGDVRVELGPDVADTWPRQIYFVDYDPAFDDNLAVRAFNIPRINPGGHEIVS